VKILLTLVLFVVCVTGCDKASDLGRAVATQQKLIDVYPEIAPGKAFLKSIAITTGGATIGESNNVEFKLQNGCNLSTIADHFGEHSVQLTPAIMSCPNGVNTAIGFGQISVAYIDKRVFNSASEVVFQLYDLTLLEDK
jgi:hypothetical protein